MDGIVNCSLSGYCVGPFLFIAETVFYISFPCLVHSGTSVGLSSGVLLCLTNVLIVANRWSEWIRKGPNIPLWYTNHVMSVSYTRVLWSLIKIWAEPFEKCTNIRDGREWWPVTPILFPTLSVWLLHNHLLLLSSVFPHERSHLYCWWLEAAPFYSWMNFLLPALIIPTCLVPT